MRRPTPASLFIYSLAVTLLAFTARDIGHLVLIASINTVLGFSRGIGRYRPLVVMLVLGVLGTFINTLIVSNTGPEVFSIGVFSVREGALVATTAISLRLLSIAGAALVFLVNVGPVEAIRSLERELWLPKGVSFAIALAMRMIPLMQRDYREVVDARTQRGFRRTPLTPSDIRSLIMPVLSLGYERALWVGIAAELRGFSLRKARRSRPVLGRPELALYVLLVVQTLYPLLVSHLVPR